MHEPMYVICIYKLFHSYIKQGRRIVLRIEQDLTKFSLNLF